MKTAKEVIRNGYIECVHGKLHRMGRAGQCMTCIALKEQELKHRFQINIREQQIKRLRKENEELKKKFLGDEKR